MKEFLWEVIAGKKSTPGLQTLPATTSAKSCGVSPTAMNSTCSCSEPHRRARPVARVVADGGRNSHEWTPAKAGLLQHFDESGIHAAALDPEDGGFIAGPKDMALALVALKLSWVDAGAATCSLASNLGLAPIHERGTPEQRAKYVAGAAPLQPGRIASRSAPPCADRTDPVRRG